MQSEQDNIDNSKPWQKTNGIFDHVPLPYSIFKQAEEIAHFGIWRVDFSDSNVLNSDNIQWSAGAYHIFGFEPFSRKVTYDFFISCIPTEDREIIKKAILDSVETKAPFSIEHGLRLPDGRIISVLVNAEITFSPEGDPLSMTGTLQDITRRKLHEEALLESESRMNRSQEIAHLGSWELDILKDELTWSDEVYRIFGLVPQEFGATYEAFLEHVHPDDRAAVNEAYSKSLLLKEDSYEIVHRVVKRSTGEIRIVHEKCEHFRDKNGIIIKSIGMVHDITERKKAEEGLLRANKAYADIINRISDAFFSFDSNWNFVYLNPIANNMGFHEGLLGKNLWEEFSEFIGKSMEKNLKEAMTLQKPVQFDWNDSNTGRWFNINVYPSEEGVTVYAQDVTHQVDAKYKLKKLIGEKETLLKEVHHRVKNNLQTINSLLNLQAATINNDDAKKAFMESQSRIKTMALIHQELYSGNIDSVNTEKYLTKLLQYLVNTYNVNEHEIEIVKSIDEIILTIDTAIPLGLLFNEIISNIFKHAFIGRPEGKINIKFGEVSANNLLLLISDNGVGLPPQYLLEESATLGIQLIQSLVQQLEGTLRADTSSGTEFRIEFTKSHI